MNDESNNRLRVLKVLQVLWKYSDESHPLTLTQIKSHLPEQLSHVNKDTIKHDIEEIQNAGIDAVLYLNKRTLNCFIGDRRFESAEVKILIDMVMSSKSITSAMSEKLVNKLLCLLSVHEAQAMSHVVKPHTTQVACFP